VVTVETVLAHKSGEWMRGTSAAPVVKADPQGVGSAITYLRRYSLAAVCGIAQEDDDGNAASHKPTNGNTSAPARSSAPAASGEPQCPVCAGAMWDNREGKKNPKAPDWKCKKGRDCDGAIWPGEWPVDRATDDEIATLRALRGEIETAGGKTAPIDKLLKTADTGALAGTVAQDAIAAAKAWLGQAAA
jgi:hypothetical protein